LRGVAKAANRRMYETFRKKSVISMGRRHKMHPMARGWESKSVEDQVQNSQSETSGKQRRHLAPSEAEARRRREVLLLSKTRVQRDLEGNQNPRYRDQLNRALADIDSQLAALEKAV
jgi:hypothetical protein